MGKKKKAQAKKVSPGVFLEDPVPDLSEPTKFPEPPPGVTRFVAKQFLADVEALNQDYRVVQPASEVCNKKKEYYGRGGTDLRRVLCKWFGNHKQKNPENYHKYIINWCLQPSATTLALRQAHIEADIVDEQQPMKKKNNDDIPPEDDEDIPPEDDEFFPPEEDNIAKSNNRSSPSIEDNLVKAVDKVSISYNTSPPPHRMISGTTTRSNTMNERPPSPPSVRKVATPIGFEAASPERTYRLRVPSSVDSASYEPNPGGSGNDADPWPVYANPKAPHLNREFVIHRGDMIEHEGTTSPGFTITKGDVVPEQVEEYEAVFIDDHPLYPDRHGVLIYCPAVPHNVNRQTMISKANHLGDKNTYHKWLDKTEKKGGLPPVVYGVFFDPGVRLDNSTFSKGERTVACRSRPHTCDSGPSFVLTWKIALAGESTKVTTRATKNWKGMFNVDKDGKFSVPEE